MEKTEEHHENVLEDIMNDDDIGLEEIEEEHKESTSSGPDTIRDLKEAVRLSIEARKKEMEGSKSEKEIERDREREGDKEREREKEKEKEREKRKKESSSYKSEKVRESRSHSPSRSKIDSRKSSSHRDERRSLSVEKNEKETSLKGKVVTPDHVEKPKDLAPIYCSSILEIAKKSNKPLRYFVIKSFTYKHLEISVEKGIWSTQAHNEQKLNESYQNAETILIFSVNNSRHFQGYARMGSKIPDPSLNHIPKNIWSAEGGWGSLFKVEWKTLYDLPFSDTLHLRNPLNSNKPVKISRDGQEVAPEIGIQLCQLLDEGALELKKKKNENKDSQKSSESKSGKDSQESYRSSRYESGKRSYRSRSRSRSPRRRRRSQSPSRKKPPVDFLSMTYDEYLKSMNGWYGQFGYPMSQIDFMEYMAWLSKQGPGFVPNPDSYYKKKRH